MRAKHYKPRPAGSLKAAIAQLVEAVGGQDKAAYLLGLKARQSVARMTDDAYPATLMRLDQVMILQRASGTRIVTDWMAAEQACVVEPLHAGPQESLPIVVGRITSDLGELLSTAAVDMQQGRLTRTNAARVLRETDETIAATLCLRQVARNVLEGIES